MICNQLVETGTYICKRKLIKLKFQGLPYTLFFWRCFRFYLCNSNEDVLLLKKFYFETFEIDPFYILNLSEENTNGIWYQENLQFPFLQPATFTDIPKVWCDGKNLNYAKNLPQNLLGIIDYAWLSMCTIYLHLIF